ncbi:MAG TPA: sulfatase [Chloroflexota bacterium]|jgi:arylsulfatase A-like enzyme|nr:sulfatase [Chloroflexota bacterium]
MPKPPNILILYPDQWRGDALGFLGTSAARTPNLDRLAREGRYFPNAFVANPVCTPSRGSFQTGRYPHATGVTANDVRLPIGETGFAEAFTAAGYRTGYIGKWHLDGDPRPGFVPPERRHGWKWWAGFNRGHRYYDGVYFRDSDQSIPAPGFEPDHQTDLAIEFLETSAHEDSRPFCLMLAWGPPHTPLDPPERRRNSYRPVDMPLPASVPTGLSEQARVERARYFGLVSALDDNVGRLLVTLDRLRLAASTLVMFTSDHGDSLGEHGLFRKTIPYDEATRVPFLARWPGQIPAASADPTFIRSVDVGPTLTGVCRLAMGPSVQGHNLSAALLGGATITPDSAYMEGNFNRTSAGQLDNRAIPEHWRALRTPDHLLVTNPGGAVRLLFDLRADPLAVHNVAGLPVAQEAQRTLLARLRAEAAVLEDPAPLGDVG